MEHQQYQIHLATKLINRFKTDFYEKTGIHPQVFYAASLGRLPLDELAAAINRHIPGSLLENGVTDIRELCRKQQICTLRIIYCMIAKNMGYPQADIARYLRRDHTSVLYNLRTFDNLYSTDPDFRATYSECLKSLNLQPNTDEPVILRKAA